MSQPEDAPRAEPARPESASKDRLQVRVDGAPRPFMRGIIVHSLMARGVGFDEANRTANAVRERLRAQGVVSKDEITAEIRKILGDAPFHSDHHLPAGVDITVHGKGKGQPFSKGVLSQSLLAAAIEPNDAFDVSREIELELIRRQVREVDRRELRTLAYEALTRTIGEAAAERYLVWRQYEDPDRPVILLLGGAAGVGKTSLALEVAHRLGIGRVLSSDSVRQIMRLTLSPEIAPAIHGSSYDAHLHFPADTLGDDPVIEGFRAQTQTVSVGVRASIDRAIAENASTILDGVSIVPGMIDLDAYSELADVIFLVVATLDPEAYGARFERRAAGQTQRAAHRYLKNLGAILHIQDHFLEMAERHGVPIVDNDSFDRAVLLIIRHVTETLRKRADFDVQEHL
ncbi:MAG: ATP cone domain-containing protein [Myxococcota bacterium]